MTNLSNLLLPCLNGWCDPIHHTNLFLLISLILFIATIVLQILLIMAPLLLIVFMSNNKFRQRIKRNILIYKINIILWWLVFRVIVPFLIKISRMYIKGIAFLKLISQRDIVFIFCTYLIVVVFSRFIFSLYNPTHEVLAPEKLFSLPRVGSDLFYGAIKPAVLMMQGKEFIFIYGPSFTLLYAVFLKVSSVLGICTEYLCLDFLYIWSIIIDLVGYILLIYFITKDNNTNRLVLLLFFTAFILGIPGSLGLERGNMDILLSLILGIAIYLSYKHIRRINYSNVKIAVVTGFLFGMMANSKLFLIPISLIAIISAPDTILTIIVFVITFVSTTYVPRVFGAPSNITDQIQTLVKYMPNFNLMAHTSVEYNHSIKAVSTLFTGCLAEQNCSQTSSLYSNIKIISGILLFSVFVLPFLTSERMLSGIIGYFRKRFSEIKLVARKTRATNKYIATQLLKIFIYQINSIRRNFKYTMLLIIITTAAINIIPDFTFSYRLYYSLPLIFLIWIISEKNKQAHWYCFLAMSFMTARGLWMFTELNNNFIFLLEPRGMNLLVLMHYYFLIKAGISLSIPDTSNKRGQLSAIRSKKHIYTLKHT